MTQSNVKIAVTGGIGSGKSTVCEIIKSAGFPVFSCDEIYKELCTRPQFLSVLTEEFGDILSEDGSLDRKKLSGIVFNDKEALKKLNSIAHPQIIRELFCRIKNVKFSFSEVPLLFENGFEKLFDGVIVVLRDYNQRIESIVKRDKISVEDASLRVKNQIIYANKDFAQYYVIHNSGDLADLRQKTLGIIEKIKINTL